ncbi:MAG TPA: hypothetical protein VFJ28_02315 [Marmoricola sp.]|nr:hypothetical protein [Marmoricola sp.]
MGDTEMRWTRWVAVVAGALVVLRSAAFVIVRVMRFAGREAQARGSDVGYVLGLAERRLGVRAPR